MQTAQRLTQLEAIVAQYYDKLGYFETRLPVTANVGEKYQIQAEIKNEIVPAIRKYEGEYARLLSENLVDNTMSDEDVVRHLAAMEQAAEQVPAKLAENPQVGSALTKLRSTLANSRLTGAAKLKVALPIIPMLVSYELELDTSGVLMQLWRTLKSTIAPPVRSPF